MKNQYYFTIADLKIIFCTGYPVNIPDNLRFFQSAYFRREDADVCCELCIQEESKHRMNPLYKGKLLKRLPFGEKEKREEILFYCMNPGKQYRVEYPAFLLRDGILFAGNNITGYLGLEFILMDYECFWLHASCVCWNGKGILFSGASGVGKSTQAKLWARCESAEILNGDRALIRRFADGAVVHYRVYGSPFAGSSHIYQTKGCTMEAVFLLRQYSDNQVKELPPVMRFLRIYGECLHCPENEQYTRHLQALIRDLVEKLEIVELYCTPDEQAVAYVKNWMEEQ